MSPNPHSFYMARAIALARRGMHSTDPNPRVGCLIVRDGVVVGSGWHQRAGEAHAEVIALQQAGPLAHGSTAYITLEPCCHYGRTPPCTNALIRAGIRRVVAAMQDPHDRVAGKGFAQLRNAGIEVIEGVLEDEARELNPGFISRMTRHRPWLRLKMAMSLDGRTALANGRSQWITGPAARRDVQRLRARASAIMSGIGTILGDDPSLNVRLEDSERQPLRIVLDSWLRTPPTARTLQLDGQVLLCHRHDAPASRMRALSEAGAQLLACDGESDDRHLDLPALLHRLHTFELNEIHLECGPTLAGTVLRHDLVDELVLYVAPCLLGNDARGLFNLPVLHDMGDVTRLALHQLRPIGQDLRLVLRPQPTLPKD